MDNPNPAHDHFGHPHTSLINTLLKCATACEQCMAVCLEEKEVTVMAHCVELDRDCAEVCFWGQSYCSGIPNLRTRIYSFAKKHAAYAPKNAACMITSIASDVLNPVEDARKPVMHTIVRPSFHDYVLRFSGRFLKF